GGAEPLGRGGQGHSSHQEYRVGGGAAGLRQRAAKDGGRSAQRSDSYVQQRTSACRLGRNSAAVRAPRSESFLAAERRGRPGPCLRIGARDLRRAGAGLVTP